MNSSLPRSRSVSRKYFLGGALGLLSTFVGGCVVAERPPHRERVRVETPPPVVVREAPPGLRAEIVIHEAPPPPRREVMVERDRPSPRHVWVAGYWEWRGGRHSWVAGHWELPPRERAVWVEPRWEHRGDSYVFIQGTWR
jgi:hypothetical protein